MEKEKHLGLRIDAETHKKLKKPRQNLKGVRSMEKCYI